MEDRYKYSFLIIIPVILFMLSFVYSEAAQPYYLDGRFDPAYFYLLNSLNLAQFSGYGVGHVDHPGTPLQMLGAIVIKVYFLLSGKQEVMVSDVLTGPEAYLRIINVTINFLNCLSVLLLGITVFKSYKSISAAILLQLSVFFSLNVFLKMSDVMVENMLIFETILLLTICLKYINIPEPYGKKNLAYVIIMSSCIGLGIATKLTFFPMLLIPFVVIKKISYKIQLVFFTVISFLIFVIPAIDNYNHFFKWVKNLVVNEGVYGSGSSGVVNFDRYPGNIKNIFLSEYLFTAIYILTIAALISYLLFRMKRGKDVRFHAVMLNNEVRLLFGIFLAITLQVMLVSKNFVPRYLLPSLILSLPCLFLSVRIFLKIKPGIFKNVSSSLINAVVIAVIIRFGFNKYVTYYDNISYRVNELRKTQSFIENNYPSEVLITSHLTYDETIALFSSTPFAGSRNLEYRLQLNRLFPDEIIYVEVWDQLYDLTRSSDLKKKFLTDKKILFIGNEINSVEGVVMKIEKDYGIKMAPGDKLFQNAVSGESIYELKRLNETGIF